MHGVMTALVGFIFVCVVFPNLVRVKPQFYWALFFICAGIILDSVGVMISPTAIGGFRVFAYAAVAFLEVGAIVLLFSACGGITWREMAGDMAHAFEVVRRGEETKTVIVPLRGEVPKPRKEPTAEREEIGGIVVPAPAPATDSAPDSSPVAPAGPVPAAPVPAAPASKKEDDRIPLE